MADDRRQQALHYITNHNVISLATTGEAGVWAAAVFYVNIGFEFAFLSANHTRHVQNFPTSPTVAGTIQEDYSSWEAIKGVQLEGNITQLRGVSRETFIAAYLKKYPYIIETPHLKEAIQRVDWFQLSPLRLYFIDNSVKFGHRDLILDRSTERA